MAIPVHGIGRGLGQPCMRVSAVHEICARVACRRKPGAGRDGDDRQWNPGEGGGIVLAADGQVAMPFSTGGMARGWIGEDGVAHVALYADRMLALPAKFPPTGRQASRRGLRDERKSLPTVDMKSAAGQNRGLFHGFARTSCLRRRVSRERPEGYPSGQRGQTVNLLAYAFGGSNPPPSTSCTHAARRFSGSGAGVVQR